MSRSQPQPRNVAAYLAHDAVQRSRRRVRVAAGARLGFDPDDVTPRVPAEAHGREVIVAELDEARVRTLYEDDGKRLLLWLEPDDVLEVIVAPVLVHVEPRPQPLGQDLLTGVEVASGCLVGFDELLSPWVEVSGGDGCFRFGGWVPEHVVGTVYRAAPPAAVAPTRERVAESTAIYDRPGKGWVLGAFIDNIIGTPVQIMGERERGMLPVRYHGEGFRVTGYVEAGAVYRAQDLGGDGWELHRPERFRPGDTLLHLPAGTCLYARPEGEIIGVMTEDGREVVAGVEDGWWHLPALWTHWCSFEVWVQDDGPAAPGPAGPADTRTIYRELVRCAL